jgi:hypothetical protein
MKKLPITPNTIIKNALRRVWLYSRERRAAIIAQRNTCRECRSIGSVAKGKECKIEVHHKVEINWDRVFKVIREEILVAVGLLEVLCKECHKKETARQRKAKKKKN